VFNGRSPTRMDADVDVIVGVDSDGDGNVEP
jgi:hypothetical protein